MDFDLNSISPEQLQILANVPVKQPPEGVVSNFGNPTTQADLQIWPTSVLMVIALLFCFNRLYVKARLMKSWSWDDVSLLIGVILSIGEYTAITLGVTKGLLGRHTWDTSILQAMTNPVMSRVSYTVLVICPWTLIALKTTFFLLFLQLFGRVRWIKITCWAGIGFVVVSNVTIAIYYMAVTNPYEYQSWGDKAAILAIPPAVFSLVADVLIFVIPFAAIIPLQMSPAKRLGALAIFLTGISAMVCSILNIYYRCVLRTSPDNSWDGVLSAVFSICEVWISIVCACIPSAVYGFRREGSIYQKIFRISTHTDKTPTPFIADSASAHSRSEIYSKAQSSSTGTRTSSDRKTIEIMYPPVEVEMTRIEGSYERDSQQTPEPAHLAKPKDVNMMV